MDTLENGGDLVGSAVEVVGKKMRTKNYWNRTPFPDGFWLAQATASFYFMAFFLVIGAASLSTVAIREMIEARVTAITHL